MIPIKLKCYVDGSFDPQYALGSFAFRITGKDWENPDTKGNEIGGGNLGIVQNSLAPELYAISKAVVTISQLLKILPDISYSVVLYSDNQVAVTKAKSAIQRVNNKGNCKRVPVELEDLRRAYFDVNPSNGVEGKLSLNIQWFDKGAALNPKRVKHFQSVHKFARELLKAQRRAYERKINGIDYYGDEMQSPSAIPQLRC